MRGRHSDRPLGRGLRAGATAVMSGALLLAGVPAVMATTAEVGESTEDTQAAEAPEEGHDHDHAPPSGATAPLPAAPSTGFGPNGMGLGAATFVPLLGDETYPVPAPPVNEDLPAEVDVRAPFAQQISCDPQDRPGVTAFALLVSDHYKRPFFSGARPCIDYASFHHDGRALDWALNAYDAQDRRIGDSVIVWLTDNDGEMAQRFGIEYLIWNHLIWHADGRGWRYYTGHPHDDHIHFSFTWDGAQMRTSWWTGVAVTQPDLGPCDVTPWQYAAVHQAPRLDGCELVSVLAPSTELGRVRPGESGGGVSMLQELLELPATGVLDIETRAALLAWQDEHDVPQTGVADDFTYAAAQGLELPELTASARAVSPQEWQSTAFTPYKRLTLTQGDTGKAVEVVQEALGVEVDGSFGPMTAEALAEFEETVPVLQLQADRRAKGDPAVVTPLTWVFLERVTHPTITVREVALEYGSIDQVADPEGERGDFVATHDELADGAAAAYSGGAVTLMQELLGIEADGSFGPMTEEAVRELQEAMDLEVTGEVDGPTWAAIEALALEEGRVPGAPGAAAERERLEAEQQAEEEAEQQRLAEEQAEKERLAEEAAEKKRQAQEKAEQERRAAEHATRLAAALADAE